MISGRYRCMFIPLKYQDRLTLGHVYTIKDIGVDSILFVDLRDIHQSRYLGFHIFKSDFIIMFEPEHKAFDNALDELLK